VRDTSFFPLTSSLCRIVRYHLGSLAMGAFVLAAVRTVRVLMVYLDQQMQRPGFRESWTVQLCLKCIHCLLWCFEQSVKFLTRFTYVFVALEGTAFCPSAVQTFKLTAKYPLQMVANEAARAVLALLQALLPPLGCSFLAYLSVTRDWRHELRVALGELHHHEYTADELPALAEWGESPPSALAVALGALVLASYVTNAFKVVYGAAIDTLFVCMFRDASSFDGKYGNAAHSQHLKAFMDADKDDKPLAAMGTSSTQNEPLVLP